MVEQNVEKERWQDRRWRMRDCRAWAAMDTMPQIIEHILGIVGEGRVMNKVATYVHDGGLNDLRHLDHATGLRKGGHAGHPEGHSTWLREDQAGFSVYLTHHHGSHGGTMEGFGVGVLAFNAATEAEVRERYERAEKSGDFWDRRRDITYIETQGRPGEPHRDDRIEVMDWNEHGVLRHTIITFTEPDYCDSGRVEQTNYVVMGWRKDPERKPFSRHEEEAEVFARYEGPDASLTAAREGLREVTSWDDIDFVWLAEEKVTRERRSI